MTKNYLKGMTCIILSGLGFALMALFVKESGDVPILQKAVFRNLIAFLITCIPLWENRKSLVLPSDAKTWGSLILRSTFGTLGLILNFYAISTINIADASIIQKLAPFIILILSYFIFKESIRLFQGLSIFIAFIGVLFVIKPSFAHFISPGALAGLGAAFCTGIAYTCVRYLGLRKISGEFIIFFFSLSSIVVLAPFLIWHHMPMTLHQTIALVLAGFSAALGQFGITFAYRYAPAKSIAVFDYSQVLFAGILGIIFLGEFPDWYSFIGYVIIISVGIALFLYNQHDRQ